MPLRPGRCYKSLKKPPYTRKDYISGIPQPKIVKFVMGGGVGASCVVKLVSREDVQIRHNALEAARVMSHKFLSKYVGDDNYLLIIRSYPHHVLRENKMMAFAGADRLQDGMRLSFGRPIGTAARVREGDVVAEIRVPEKFIPQAKEAMRRMLSKIGIKAEVVIENLSEVKK
ncbi:MAG: 50S ribosomal protein L16 [Sulfolobales archaeon]|nr:50S ribosomal protein L16 [Sulfolobales archaeon]